MTDNMWSRIVNALNPCVHIWEVTATMYDNPENPRHTRILKTCTVCGETKQEDFVAPGEPPHEHSWVTFSSTRIVDDLSKPLDKVSTLGWKFDQKCACDEIRQVNTQTGKTRRCTT